MIGETLLITLAGMAIAIMHGFAIYGHIIFTKAIICRTMDFGGWMLYLAVWFGTLLLAALWLIIIGI